MMQLRKHQSEFSIILDHIVAGKPIRKVIAYITPGGGKSLFALLAGKLIKEGLADSICWIVPRLTLAHQAELNTVDPHFSRMLNHGVSLRSATNEINPCRGTLGYTTTYQAIGLDDRRINAHDFALKRYILIADEIHHAEEGGVWHKALQPLIDRAKYLFLLSGTLSRGDGQKIAFIPYSREGDLCVPDFRDTDDTAVISYSRSDALREKAILPIRFILADGLVEWEDKNGRRMDSRLSTAVFDTGSAIQTALNTQFAEKLLRDGITHWREYKSHQPRSKVAVVTANIKHAKKILGFLSEWGYRARIATSDDTPEAIKAIKAFRGRELDIMVFVAMCSEGLDIPSLTHIICLTHIRTREWIEQLVARAVRVDRQAGPYRSQMAFVFAPDDWLFRQVVEQIRAEQLPFVQESDGAGAGASGNGNGERPPGITPLNGEITGTREIHLGEIPDGYIPEEIKTIKEREEEILHKIEMHVRKFSFDNRYKPQRISFEIKANFGKSRRHMTLEELKSCLQWVRRMYPIEARSPEFLPDGVSRTRGGRQRVPTKAQPWPMFGE